MTKTRTLTVLTLLTLALTACGSKDAAPEASSAAASSASASVTATAAAASVTPAQTPTSDAEESSAPATGSVTTASESVAAEPSQEAEEQGGEEAEAEQTAATTETDPGDTTQDGGDTAEQGGDSAEGEKLSQEEQLLDSGFSLDDMPADMTIGAERASTVRPETVDIFRVDGTTVVEGQTATVYRSTQGSNPTSFSVVYLPGGEYGAPVEGFHEGAQLGSGTCSLRLDSDTARAVRCEYPVVEGGIVVMSGDMTAHDVEQLDLFTDFFIQASAHLAYQMKN